MNFLKTLGGFVGGSGTGGLPYTIDSGQEDPQHHAYALPEFYLLSGKSKADPTHAVSIFKSKQPASQLTQNALKRIKTLRHPNILAYLDGVELPNNGHVLIVTEAVMPLTQYLDALRQEYGTSSEEFQMIVAWGLRSVLLALKFLNCDCKLFHGRLNPQAIFVTKGGDWKVGGLEMTSEWSNENGPSYMYTSFEQFADANYKAPECQQRNFKNMAINPPFVYDIWSFGCVLSFVYNENQISQANVTQATNIPHAIRTHFRKTMDPTQVSRRPGPDKWLSASFFDTPFIKRMDFLENLAVKTPEEKAEYYKELCANLHTLPKSLGIHKVLPALKQVVEFGATPGVKNGPVKLDPSASHMLPAMVQIGSMLPAEEFKEQVLPIIVKLFSCNDRAVRVQLLQMMEKFAVHFDAKLVNSSVVFDNICSGFSDASPVLRELTVKSMLHFADKLSDSNLNTRVMKHFAKLQTDPEPAIRTNTTICLGRIASKLNDSTRPKVLFPAFAKAMRDPFPHARLAGLRSMTACEAHFSPQGIASNILPAIAPLLLDVSVTVRDQAALSMELFMKKVQEEAVQMKLREEEQARQEKLKQQQTSTSVDGAQSSTAATATTAGGSGYASALTGWASSAVASSVHKIVGAGESNATTATTASSSASAFQTASAPTHNASSTRDFALDEDDDQDAWGDDEDLDILSPKTNKTSSIRGLGGFSSTASSHSTVRLSVARNDGLLSTTTTNSSSASVSLGMNAADGWGDDNWGGNDNDDELGFGTTTTKTSGSSSRTSSFGNTSSNTRTSSFGNTNSDSRTSSFGSSPAAASAPRKSIAERKAEAQTKRLGAMKLESSAKKGDEWDNWDF